MHKNEKIVCVCVCVWISLYLYMNKRVDNYEFIKNIGAWIKESENRDKKMINREERKQEEWMKEEWN
jgi:hypothetical protein